MNAEKQHSSIFPLELRLALLLAMVYLIIPYLVVPERYQYNMAPSELAIKASYIGLAFLNMYVWIPRFLHKGRYWAYAGLALLTVAAGAFIEEGILEFLFYPDTRGAHLTLRGLQWSASKVGFVLIIFSTFKLIWDYQKKQKQMNELESEKVKSELKFLKSQVNPHVLFNNLNNIYSYALEKSDKVPDMLLKLSEIMRYMLHEGENEFVPLKKEINYLKDFIELQKLRLEERGHVNLQVEGDPADWEIAPLLLVAFVENSFKHSMRSEIDDIEISFNLKIEDAKLYFESRNTFSESDGPDPIGTNERENGIGLENVRKRLQLIYKEGHHLDIYKRENYFIVELMLDLEIHEPEMLNY